MKSDCFFVVRSVDNTIASGHLATIEEAYALIAGQQGKFLIEKFDPALGLVESRWVSMGPTKGTNQ